MADTAIAITAGSGTNVDTRTEATNGNHRQVIVIGDPATNAGVAPVDATSGLSVTLTTAIPAGSAAIGKLAANSGVDIGDVDVASIAAGNNNIGDVDVASVVTGTGATNLGKAEDAAHASSDVGVMALTVRSNTAASTSGTDGDYQPLITDTNGRLHVLEPSAAGAKTDLDTIAGAVSGTEMQVDVLTLPNVTLAAGTNTNEVVGDAAHDAAVAGNPVLIGGYASAAAPTDVTADGDAARIWTTLKGAVNVADAGGSLTVDVGTALPAGTNAIGKLAANSGVDIGDVDITSIAAGDNNIGNVDVVTLPALAAGTNAIGKLAANSGVDIGDVDVTSIAAGDNNIGNVDIVSLPALAAGTNAIGKLIPPDYDVTSHSTKAVKYYTNAGAVTDGIIWSPAAGKRWHVTSLFINVSAAATVTLEDDLVGGDSAVMKMELAANSGVAIPFGDMYPLTSGEDAADLIITTSAGNVYVTAVGYEI